MNRTDRMLAIVLELQGKRRQRAEDLARTFEVSKRTIYRDLAALGQTGVPVVSTPGRGYALMDGYFLPPLSFGTDEATMLLLGADVMAQSFDAQYRAAAQSAARKIAGVLPGRLRPELDALRESIHFIVGGAALRPDQAAKLQLLRRAIIEQRSVRFRYFARRTSGQSAAVPKTREADPYALAHVGQSWYVTGYCHLRRDVRTFRLERMENVAALAETFERPSGFQMHRPDLFEAGSFDVSVLFDADIARWVREAPSFFTIAEQETADGLLVTLHVRDERDVLQWILGWGRHARVLEPTSLRQRVASEAEAMMRISRES